MKKVVFFVCSIFMLFFLSTNVQAASNNKFLCWYYDRSGNSSFTITYETIGNKINDLTCDGNDCSDYDFILEGFSSVSLGSTMCPASVSINRDTETLTIFSENDYSGDYVYSPKWTCQYTIPVIKKTNTIYGYISSGEVGELAPYNTDLNSHILTVDLMFFDNEFVSTPQNIKTPSEREYEFGTSAGKITNLTIFKTIDNLSYNDYIDKCPQMNLRWFAFTEPEYLNPEKTIPMSSGALIGTLEFKAGLYPNLLKLNYKENKELLESSEGNFCSDYLNKTDCKASKDYACVWNENKNLSNGGFCNTNNLLYVKCGDAKDIPHPAPQIVSFAVNFLKILTPIILIAVSVISLLKALSASNEDEIKKAQKGLIRKVIAAVMVFLVTAIVQFVIMKVADDSETGHISDCLNCFLNNNCNDSTYYKYNLGGQEYYRYLNGKLIKSEYSITYKLENVSSSNTSISIKDSENYHTELTINEGFNVINRLKVKKDGQDITDKVYNNGIVNIKRVTGDIVIIAEAILQKENKESENVIYYNVAQGKYCTKKEYEKSYNVKDDDYSNSKYGYNGLNGTENQNSCLKFYSYAEDSTTRTMILDHSLATAAWTEPNYIALNSGDNTKGPNDVLEILYNKTKNWKGTITPEDYTMKKNDDSVLYTIEYSKTPSYSGATTPFKAKLITSPEVEKIVGNTNWNLYSNEYSGITLSTWYAVYFQNNSDGYTCASSGCKYGWLYDRTNSNCEMAGCLNNSYGSVEFGYWTASSSKFDTLNAVKVSSDGSLENHDVTSTLGGVRPVIIVPKS